MRTEAAAPVPVQGSGTGWADHVQGLEARLSALLAGRRAGSGDIPVRVLGVRDELAPAAPEELPRDAVVHVYGHQVVVGPLPDGGTAACPRCLARRWQDVRPAPLRDALELGSGTRAVGP